RLGDLVAGTIVVRERAVVAPTDGAEAEPTARGTTVARAALSDAEFALLERYVARRRTLDPERRASIAARMAAQLRAHAAHAAPGVPPASTDAAWLLALHERERAARATGPASRAGARRTDQRDLPHALVMRGAERWRTFAALVAAVEQRGGLRALGDDEVSDFVARYRELATDLARLRTAARGRELDAIFYLGRLVAAGHNLLYRRTDAGTGAVRRFVFGDVPAELRRSWRPIALAALLLFGPAVAAFEGARRDPAIAAQLVPAGLIDRAESGVVRARRGGGYLPEREASMRGPLLASLVMTNNVQITFYAFAFGVTAGIGTALALVFNGVSALGAPLGLYASKGIADQIIGFVLPHGVLELTAICVSGGAGFLLAGALLLPGARTRRDALVDEGMRALRLITASTLMLVVAGLLEGNVSPRVWPLGAKAAVSLATVALLVAYLSLRGPRAPEAAVTASRAP
ncbi:MAG: stage II sporulation protein M, partial [Gemmatirosa sp.]|nr:stage II sporulation protein M [Gemmatirosa sp.]